MDHPVMNRRCKCFSIAEVICRDASGTPTLNRGPPGFCMGRDRLVDACGKAIRKQMHPSEGHDSPLKAIKLGVYTVVAFL
eukprot:1157590-Pelagomonas_calceolata.AAC.5